MTIDVLVVRFSLNASFSNVNYFLNVYSIVRWDEIREELCISNVIQRDSIMFATKLHPCLVDLASANEKEVKNEKDPKIEIRVGVGNDDLF